LRAALPRPRTVSVNGTIIPREVIAREMQNHPADKPLEAWQRAARALVVRELLLAEASRLGITAAPVDTDDGSRETEEEARIRQLIGREVVSEAPDEAACRCFFDANRARFRTSDLFEAAHILIAAVPESSVRAPAREAAEAILAAVVAEPARFDAIAAERSDCAMSRGNGGRLGQISRGQSVEEFDAALMAMAEGEIRLVETRYGFHILRLDHRACGQCVPFELAQDRIRTYLALRAERRAQAAYVAALASRAEITGVELVAAATEGEDGSG